MYTLVIYEQSDAGLDFNHYIEVERQVFEDEQDAMDYASDGGYLDSHLFSISIEDEHGTVTYL